MSIGFAMSRRLAVLGSLSLACASADPSAGSVPVTAAGSGNVAGAAGTAVGGGGAAGASVGGAGTGGASGSAGLAGSGGAGSAGVAGLGGGAGSAGSAGTGGVVAGGSAGVGGDINAGGLAEGEQTARPIGTPYASNGYWEYLPPHYGNGFQRPLLVFWAGVGENGDGSLEALQIIVQRHGPPMLIDSEQWPDDRPFIVLSPQHDAATDRPTPSEIYDFLAFALEYYDVDPARVYLTGLSSGARGFWAYLGEYAGQQVAAAALIAADSSVAYDAGGCGVVNEVALWTFHGENDSEVPIADDNEGMANFAACPEPPRQEVKYTVYPGTGHQDSWTKTYDGSAGHDIYSWLLSKMQ